MDGTGRSGHEDASPDLRPLVEAADHIRGAATSLLVLDDGAPIRLGPRTVLLDAALEAVAAGRAPDADGVVVRPLVGTDGALLGAIASAAGPEAGSAALVELAAAHVAARLELATTRTRIEQLRAERAESEQITALAWALLGSINVGDVVRNAVVHLGRIDIGTAVTLGVPEEGDAVLRLRHGGEAASELTSRWPDLDVDEAFPLALAHRSGTLVAAAGDDERFPGLADELHRLGADRYLATPMRGPDGAVVGVMGVAARRDQDVDRALLVRLASLVGDAVERTALLERSATTARILSTAIRPSRIDPVPGIELAASFGLADDRALVGGDWYDVLPGDHAVGLVVGDVAGHDVGAARTAARLRFALAALFDERPDDPLWVLRRLHSHARRARTRRAATILLAVVDPTTGAVRVASAGHPVPAVTSGRSAAFAALSPLPPVGTLDGEGTVAELHLAIGDRLVLFSDGVVERRTESIDVGLDRLLARVSAHDGPLRSLVRVLADGSGGEDDASVLAVERTG